MKLPLNRGGLRFYLVLIALAGGYATARSILCGTPLIILGAIVHFWAKGCLHQNRMLSMGGPYRLVRHPFYLANACVDAGIAIMSGWWLLCAALPVWWLVVYIPVMRREEAHLASLFGARYHDYQQQVPMLIPFRCPIAYTGEGFSWQNCNITSGRESARVLRLLAYPLLFLLCREVRSEGPAILFSPNALDLTVLAALLVLYGVAWEIEHHVSKRRLLLPTALRGTQFRAIAGAVILTVALLVPWFETEMDSLIVPAGIAILTLSVLAYLRRSVLLAECIALVGAAVLCELLWLTALPVLFYAALLLDDRPLGALPGPKADGLASPLLTPRPGLYCFLLSAGIVSAALKEVLMDRPPL